MDILRKKVLRATLSVLLNYTSMIRQTSHSPQVRIYTYDVPARDNIPKNN